MNYLFSLGVGILSDCEKVVVYFEENDRNIFKQYGLATGDNGDHFILHKPQFMTMVACLMTHYNPKTEFHFRKVADPNTTFYLDINNLSSTYKCNSIVEIDSERKYPEDNGKDKIPPKIL